MYAHINRELCKKIGLYFKAHVQYYAWRSIIIQSVETESCQKYICKNKQMNKSLMVRHISRLMCCFGGIPFEINAIDLSDDIDGAFIRKSVLFKSQW